LAEFQYNNHVHSATQQTPFMLDSGRHPRMGFEPHQADSRMETVNEFKDRMDSTLAEARSALAKAKEDMARYYNQRRVPAPEYQVGDKVFLDASDIRTTRPSQKLAHRYLGPYVVQRRVGRNAYRLRLPTSMSRLHPVFNVVKLLPAPEDPIPGRRAHPPPPPEIVDGEEHYIVEQILDSRFVRGRLQFLVKWEGYGYEENTWVPEQDVSAPDKLREFYRTHPGAPRRIRSVAFQSLMSRASRTQHPRGGVMSGDNPFSASSDSAPISAPISGPNPGSYSGGSPSSSELRSASASIPKFRSRNCLGGEASRLVRGIKVQGCQGSDRW
jgi:hypothetical protein